MSVTFTEMKVYNLRDAITKALDNLSKKNSEKHDPIITDTTRVLTKALEENVL